MAWFIIGLFTGGIIGGGTMALFSANAYEKGYEDARRFGNERIKGIRH